MIIGASLFAAGVLSLLASIVLARSVSVNEFGFYSMTLSLQTVLGMFSSFSIGTAVAKFVAEYNVRDVRHALKFAKAGLRLVLLFSIITTFIYFALAKPIGNGLYNEPGIVDLIPFSALAMFSGALLSLMVGIAQGNHRMRLLSSMQVSAPAISLIIIIVLLPYIGIRVAFVSLFLAQATVVLSAMYQLERTGFPMLGRVEADDTIHHRRMLLSFAIPAMAGSVVVTLLFWIGSTVLVTTSGFLAVGYFAVAMVFFQALSFLPSSVIFPLVPIVAAMSVHSRKQIGSLISRSLRIVSILLFPIFFAIALFSRDLIVFLYGPGYYESSVAAYLMVTACYYYGIAMIVCAPISGLGRMWVGLGLNLLWGTVFLILMMIATPSFGPSGLAMAFAMSYVIHVANSIAVSNRVLNLEIRGALLIIFTSVVLFTAGYISITDVVELSLVAKISLLAFGMALMAYLGRIEFMTALNRLLKR